MSRSLMKRLSWIFVCLLWCGPLRAQESSSHETSERLFLPKDMFWGYTQFDLAPPHNEPDPNLCRADAGNFGGVNAPCNAFGR